MVEFAPVDDVVYPETLYVPELGAQELMTNERLPSDPTV